MLNPVVIPIPLAIAVIASLVAALGALNAWAAAQPAYPTWTPPPIEATTGAGRHRLDSSIEPYRPRPWDAVVADHRQPLIDFEHRADDVVAQARTRSGYSMWSWSDDWALDTREMAAIR